MHARRGTVAAQAATGAHYSRRQALALNGWHGDKNFLAGT